MFDKLSFDLQGRHFEGKHVAIGALTTVASLALIKLYCNGGTCYIQKDLTGHIAVITGGNTGIGKETARTLANMGCSVIIGARDTVKNDETVAELSKTARGKVTSLKLDLADKASIKKFAEDVERQLNGQPLNYLVNNAGVMAIP